MEQFNKSAGVSWANKIVHMDPYDIDLNTGLTLKIEVEGYGLPEGQTPGGTLKISAYDHQGNKFNLQQKVVGHDVGTAFFDLETYVEGE